MIMGPARHILILDHRVETPDIFRGHGSWWVAKRIHGHSPMITLQPRPGGAFAFLDTCYFNVRCQKSESYPDFPVKPAVSSTKTPGWRREVGLAAQRHRVAVLYGRGSPGP